MFAKALSSGVNSFDLGNYLKVSLFFLLFFFIFITAQFCKQVMNQPERNV